VAAKKVQGAGTVKERKRMIDRDSHQLSIRRQCELVDVNRNRLTPPPDNPGAREIQLCRLIDEVVRVAGRAPEIFNTDQGCQFTSRAWRERLTDHGIRISMDGKGRWLDNVFIERLWRTIKYDELHLREFSTLPELETILEDSFKRYNRWRPHDSLGGSRP
tara:strand:+ start:19671 stop:20153 length:483 start_codon:yes stop_codon:yes gene_type:complete